MDAKQSAVWPIPQEMALRKDALNLREAVVVLPGSAEPSDVALADLFADMVLDDFNLVVPVVQGRAPKGKKPIRFGVAGRSGVKAKANLPGAEGYLLHVSADGVEAVGRDQRGAQYAIATLLQLAQRHGPDVVLRGAEVRDWPYKPVRMVHLYLPGVEHLSYARRYLRDFLVRYKYNGVFVEVGGGVRLRNRREIPAGWRTFVDELRAIGDTIPIYGEHCPLGPNGRFADSIHTHLGDGGYIEPDDLSRLSEWARELNLDFVPEVQSLMHCYFLSGVYREIAELKEADFPDSYCPCNPKSYEILFDVLSSYLSLTKCKSVHIGHDEWRAGGLCPECAKRDTGELFGHDVVKIAAWLRERGQGVWMWGDHLIPKHNADGGSSHEGVVWYDHPQTKKAGEIIRASAPDITLLNWSWSIGAPGESDQILTDLGFKQIYGNFHGPNFKEWGRRSANPMVLGGEVSSWCAWEDFELGMIHYPDAMYGINMLWSNHWPKTSEAAELSALQMPKLRDRMRRGWEKPRLYSEAVAPVRKRVLSIDAACNAPVKGETWDLTGFKAGKKEVGGVPLALVNAAKNDGKVAVVAERRHRRKGQYPHDTPAIPVDGTFASLIFWQAASAKGGRPMHAGDGTHYPREAAELLGWYEILYADGLTRTAEVRYGENVSAWDSGFEMLYYAREVAVGKQAGGEPLVLWGLEWTNPRPAVKIESVRLRGAKQSPETRPKEGVSDARPMLLGITGIEGPKWEDYRSDRKGKLPGLG